MNDSITPEPPPVDQALTNVVIRRDLAGLAADLERLAQRPGVWPPAAQRLRTAAHQLLADVLAT